ncbi:MAG: hypothetical protein AAFX87_02470 [Bacteroidota bacterium]
MKLTFNTILFLFLSLGTTYSQINYKAVPTGKHAQWLRQAKGLKKKLSKTERVAIKDSLKGVKRIRQFYQDKVDSVVRRSQYKQKLLRKLENEALYAQGSKKYEQLKAQAAKHDIDLDGVKEALNDSTKWQSLGSLAYDQAGNLVELNEQGRVVREYTGISDIDELKQFKSIEALKARYYQYLGIDSTEWGGKLQEPDSLTFQQFLQKHADLSDSLNLNDSIQHQWQDMIFSEANEQKIIEQIKAAELKELGNYSKEVEAFRQRPEEYKAYGDEAQSQVEAYRQYEQGEIDRSDMKKMAFKQQDQLFEAHQDKLSAVKDKMKALKQKYSSVPNSNDLSTAVKRNSLEKEPFGNRFVYGGNFELASTDPVILDGTFNLAYKLRKPWQVGVGFTYRQNFGAADTASIAKDAMSFRVFTNHNLWKGFFGQVEVERSYRSTSLDRGDISVVKWRGENAINLGLGRRFKVTKKLNATIMILYDFLHDYHSLIHKNPIRTRIGFEWD